MALSPHARMNRRYWDRVADEYQDKHGAQLASAEPRWGVWGILERDLQVLGDVEGLDVLEFGCGAAQWSILLAERGARPVGLDNSSRQLQHARRLMREAGVDFPLVHASGENVPLPDQSLDIVFCDHGAMTFADPSLTVPEAFRLLRPGGLLAFNMASPLVDVCWSERTEQVEDVLHGNYFEMRRWEFDGEVVFQLPYGEWIRLFRRVGFLVEDLVEIRPPEAATTTYDDYVALQWARRWPAENVWKVRRPA
jgi:ubiquinone/menaquinone biosynthesis C-methylase UbiE